jgi:hypothetical protein
MDQPWQVDLAIHGPKEIINNKYKMHTRMKKIKLVEYTRDF